MVGADGFGSGGSAVDYALDRLDEGRNGQQEGERFVAHKPENLLWYVFLGLVAVGFLGVWHGGVVFAIGGVGCWFVAGAWLCWSWSVRGDWESGYFALCLFKDGAERRFCDMENKLMNLMEQSPRIPERFRDGYVSVRCTELDDMRVSFVVAVDDVVGAIEFIEKNADKWAAAFGDRDGAEVSTISTGVYRLDFDLLGTRAGDVVVEW